MKSETHGFSLERELRWRRWGGAVADVWDVARTRGPGGVYVSPDPRLFVLLSLDDGGEFEIACPETGETIVHRAAGGMSFIPAGVATKARYSRGERIRHFDLHFSEAWAARCFGRDLDQASLARLRLEIIEPRLVTLAAAIVEECETGAPLHDHYGEGLVKALLSVLFDVRPRKVRRRPGLTRGQLAQVIRIMTERCFEPLPLADIAGLVSLSESHFSHAFKVSTGIPPHRWQMQERIRRVQDLLVGSRSSLAEVAITAGFSDQAHFTRVFKTYTGVTPTEWRRRIAR
ncbi:MAG: AraC family transcriptional regulator [Mesorhizobium sp.]|nr:AraC family transcriptional regulator [Mesorhizobium sp.]MCO5160149.1 AraC family transcriptional regulator [Mesorhizobium sp.]